MNGDGSPDTVLLETAEYYLKTRDFELCRHSILSSPRYHPTNLTAAQILTLSDVLSNSTRPDCYSILSLSRFTHNPTLIRTRFKTLASLLNPNTNPLSLSSEAFSLVLEAHSVLSDPTKKLKYDDWLRISESENSNQSFLGENSSFWTMCPYCYYVYEYSRVYLDCYLRCQNGDCRKGFTAVEIRVPPPEEVAGSGRYLCLGFSPVGFKGFSTWSPFSTVSKDDDEEIGEDDGIDIEKMGFKRRKSVGMCAKKVMGKGVRVSREEINRIAMRI